MPPTKRPIADYLPDPGSLDELRKIYVAGRSTVLAELRAALPRRYEPSRAFVDSIDRAFYGQSLPDDSAPGPRSELSIKDRERCLIALLATQEERLFLAVHMYMALMEGVSQEEIAHILFLTGIYTGVSNFSAAIEVEARLLGILEDSVSPRDPIKMQPGAIYAALVAAFGE